MNMLAQILLAFQEASAEASESMSGSAAADDGSPNIFLVLGILFGGIIVTTWLGRFLGSRLKVPDHAWRIGVVLYFILVSVLVFYTKDMKFGVDLRGGVTIIGQLNLQDTEPGSQKVDIKDVIPQLKMRIDPGNVREIAIRPLGTDKMEVIIPDVAKEEAERIWRRLTSAGQLFFRIVADENNPAHNKIFEAARATANQRRSGVFAEDEKIGEWFLLAREQGDAGVTNAKPLPFKFLPMANHLVRDLKTGRLIDMQDLGLDYGNNDGNIPRQQLNQWCEDNGVQDLEILMVHPTRDRLNVEGKYLKSVSRGIDQNANPRIEFSLTSEGGKRLYSLTQANKPTNGRKSLLGIVLDGHLQSAPSINEPIRTQGVIEGRFTDQEIDDYKAVLNSGKLDVALRKNWISMDQIQSTLGEELKTKGLMAIGISLGLVLVFMIFYYRFCGIVACIALALNLCFTLGMLMMINVNLTLTGLAGLVLTIGMSVDASVLIFERIREELDRGAALRMAIRNGFDRATTTIVDANLTTLITAVILYVIGTDQIRSFAVTLIVGILMCMFTAIFCARLMFTIAERNRWISALSMGRLVSGQLMDFLSKRGIAITVSMLLIAVGIVAFIARGHDILDTDLAGGSTARVEFVSEKTVDEVKSTLEAKEFKFDGEPIRYDIAQMQDNPLAFKIDSSLPVIEDADDEVQLRLDEIISETFEGQLKMLNMDYDPAAIRIAKADGTAVESPSTDNGGADDGGAGDGDAVQGGGPYEPSLSRYETIRSNWLSGGPVWKSGFGPEIQEGDTPQEGSEQEGEGVPQETSSSGETGNAGSSEPGGQEGATSPDLDMGEMETPASGEPGIPQTAEPQEGGESETANLAPELFIASTDLTFRFPIAGDSVKGYLVDAAAELGNVPLSERDIDLTADGVQGIRDRAETWTVKLSVVNADDAKRVFDKVQATMADQPYFASSSGVGGQVAGRAQQQAIIAIIASLIGIIAYVWIRFQNVAFGLAAIVALVHDVLFVLGAIAVSYWLSGSLGFLLVDDFRISLSVVAALLTIIGYSLNDTIVVFDRIREVRGKRSEITAEMINQSISQTLSRTILTSITTLLVVVILYFLGGESIHAFAFALMIGVVVGTYSSIFIASPSLLWLMNRGIAPPPVAADKPAGDA